METGIHADALWRDCETIYLLSEVRLEDSQVRREASLLTLLNERLF